MRCLCDFFFYFNAKIIEELIINTNDDLMCGNIIKFLLRCNNDNKNIKQKTLSCECDVF